MADKKLSLEIISPEKSILHKKVDRVRFPGEGGSFEVLYSHSPLISVLIKGEIQYWIDDKEESVELTSGFVRIENNEIKVCVEL